MNTLMKIYGQSPAFLDHTIGSIEKLSLHKKVGMVALAIFCALAVCYTAYLCWQKNKVIPADQPMEQKIAKAIQNSPILPPKTENHVLDRDQDPILFEPESPKSPQHLHDLPRKPQPHELEREQQFILNDKTIFKKLQNITIQIEGDERKGSGAVVEHNEKGMVLVTEQHVAHSGGTACVGQQEIDLQDCETFHVGTQTMFVLEGLNKTLAPLPMLSGCKLEIGDVVYFGGYPYSETEVHLHMGRVSSVGKEGKIKIDGTAVPGMSGGPIVFQWNNTLYVVGTIASETFDPINGFVSSLDRLYNDQLEIDLRHEDADEHRKEIAKSISNSAAFTKVPKGSLYNAALDKQYREDPDFFIKIWDDLNKNGVIKDDGTLIIEKVKRGHLGLRKEFQQYEEEILAPLEAKIRNLSIDSSAIELPYKWEAPTDALNTVGLSLVQSLSTGIISGSLFQTSESQALEETDPMLRDEKFDLATRKETSPSDQGSSEFPVGKDKRLVKARKNQQRKGQQLRADAKQDDQYINTGAPPLLYRFVSTEAAKEIKKNGIVHVGSDKDEIPFIVKPSSKMATSVGAKSFNKMITVYTDKIPNLTAENIDKMSQRNGVVVYKINMSIPPEAIEVSEA